MKVKDYAEDVNLSTAEILKRCRELGIKAEKGEDTLNDDDIIILDNTINLISTDSEMSFDEDEAIDETVDEIISSKNITNNVVNAESKQKLKKKDVNKAEFNNLKKEMYNMKKV